MQSTFADRRALAALGIFWLALLNGSDPVLLLSSGYANLLVFWLLMLLPWGVAVAALTRMAGRARWGVLVLTVPAILVGLFPLVMSTFDLLTTRFGETDSSFAPVQRAPLPRGGELVVYWTDCGATCSVGAVVRHERALVPGVLVIGRTVYSSTRFRAEDVRVQRVGAGYALVEDSVVLLRRWVYL